jgi:hypothetical protein
MGRVGSDGGRETVNYPDNNEVIVKARLLLASILFLFAHAFAVIAQIILRRFMN